MQVHNLVVSTQPPPDPLLAAPMFYFSHHRTLPGGPFRHRHLGLRWDAYVNVQSLWRVQLHESCMKACMKEVLLTTLLALSLPAAALAGPDGRATATVVLHRDGDTIRGGSGRRQADHGAPGLH